MSRNLDDIMNELSPARRKKVEARAAQLIAEETIRQAKHNGTADRHDRHQRVNPHSSSLRAQI